MPEFHRSMLVSLFYSLGIGTTRWGKPLDTRLVRVYGKAMQELPIGFSDHPFQFTGHSIPSHDKADQDLMICDFVGPRKP